MSAVTVAEVSDSRAEGQSVRSADYLSRLPLVQNLKLMSRQAAKGLEFLFLLRLESRGWMEAWEHLERLDRLDAGAPVLPRQVRPRSLSYGWAARRNILTRVGGRGRRRIP